MLTIHLKTGSYIDIPVFKKVTYLANGTVREKTPDQFSGFIIGDGVTYNFEGKINISVRGSEILYIEFH